ncbi:putative Pre-mRNA-splicing factor ATP-dependent RNA helicase prp16 [Paratrimastix pyriformis]|uniref:Pre-mRNA-splicing factor ATP-dependent RNA helicase prp16 n=1 Tax=Paratrimastix pyriformis TaxID=342808 RepID=A0ABQ8UET9_9EUKA|nr:putative Pre-mRNA-splicing factor ATP-dependent RNA helicase prp16 [Paratrimastix pyriformis]
MRKAGFGCFTKWRIKCRDSGFYPECLRLREWTFSVEELTKQRDQFLTAIRSLTTYRSPRFYREERRLRARLPILAARTEIMAKLADNQALVVTAATGSGKSTQLAQYILDENPNAYIVVTQPRKIATTSLADRVTEEWIGTPGAKAGGVIGYHVGGHPRFTSRTQIVFMTDRMLLMEMLRPGQGDLPRYTHVVVDECHERSIYTDLLLSRLKDTLTRRPEFRVLVTSATMDTTLFTNFFGGCPLISVPGRTFPVRDEWDSKSLADFDERDIRAVVEAVVRKALAVHGEQPAGGDILAFLPGQAEVERAVAQCGHVPGLSVLGLYGKMKPEEQARIFDPAPPGMRKLVFATNAAETSITINGIVYVIDSGIERRAIFDTRRSLDVLTTCLITKSSAKQRAGRAGRTQPGICWHLYTRADFEGMDANVPSEIMRSSPMGAILLLKSLGVTDLSTFNYLERVEWSIDEMGDVGMTQVMSACGAWCDVSMRPSMAVLRHAEHALQRLGALRPVVELGSAHTEITSDGILFTKLPIDASSGRLLLNGIRAGLQNEAIRLAALISVAGMFFWRGGTDEEKQESDQAKARIADSTSDLLTILHAYTDWLALSRDRKGAHEYCQRNYINVKAIKTASSLVREITDVLRDQRFPSSVASSAPVSPAPSLPLAGSPAHQMPSSPSGQHLTAAVPVPPAPHACSDDDDDNEDALSNGDSVYPPEMSMRLRRLIAEAYFMNASVLNGFPQAGFTTGMLQPGGCEKTAFLHPGSCVAQADPFPTCVVCCELAETSRLFMRVVTVVDPSWLGVPIPPISMQTATIRAGTLSLLPLVKAVRTLERRGVFIDLCCGKGSIRMAGRAPEFDAVHREIAESIGQRQQNAAADRLEVALPGLPHNGILGPGAVFEEV